MLRRGDQRGCNILDGGGVKASSRDGLDVASSASLRDAAPARCVPMGDLLTGGSRSEARRVQPPIPSPWFQARYTSRPTHLADEEYWCGLAWYVKEMRLDQLDAKR